MKKFVLSIPSLEEQTAIATLLSDMGAEISALESRLAKARHVKHGHDAGADDRQDTVAISNRAFRAC